MQKGISQSVSGAPAPTARQPIPAADKAYVLRFLKAIGCFHIARALTSRKLRIVGYHGLCKADESLVCSWLFMDAATFKSRINWLVAHDFVFLTISDAVRLMQEGKLPKRSVAITFDDGWQSVLSVGLPILKSAGVPATIYVSTFYVTHQEMVFSAALNYAKAKRGDRRFRADRPWRFMHGLHKKRSRSDYDGSPAPDSTGTIKRIHVQDEVLRKALRQSDISITDIENNRMFHYMNEQELAELSAAGIDVQLHTHSHRMTDIGHVIKSEIETNQREILKATGKSATHFAYPCGYVTPERVEHLRKLGVKSAVTCTPGFNDAGVDLLQLRRFVDNNDMPQIVFEAEMSGLMPILRSLKSVPRKLSKIIRKALKRNVSGAVQNVRRIPA